MNFKGYDIFSKLIIGILLLFVLVIAYFPTLNLDDIGEITFIIGLSYIIGFLLDTIASWVEDLYYLSWGGKASDRMMKGKGVWKIKAPSNLPQIKEKLKIKSELKECSDEELFSIAMRTSNSERVKEFQNSYAFSRGLLTTFIVIFVILIPKLYCYWYFFPISLVLISIVWLRAKQRAYYFAKEVIMNSFYN